MKDSKRIIRGFTETSINKNIARLEQRYPKQTPARDTAVALNIAEDQAIKANRPALVRKLSKWSDSNHDSVVLNSLSYVVPGQSNAK